MWAITSYFNPIRYKRRLSNYRIFRANLCVSLVTVELSFDGRFELTQNDADILIQIHGGAVLWQKERLLNLAIKSVPPEIENIAWIDCDIIFARLDWAKEAVAQLRVNDVAQLFSDMVDLTFEEVGPRDEHTGMSPSAQGIVALNETGENAFVISSSDPSVRPVLRGLAWAARTKLLKEHGFYDACIIGSGDRSMAYALFGRFDEVMRSMSMNEIQQKHYLRWAVPFHEAVGGRIGYVPGRVYHLWHGDIQNRRYDERHKMLKYNFDPEKDVEIGPNGAWTWARPRTELAEVLSRYFVSRDDDGVKQHNDHSSATPEVGAKSGK